MEVKRINRRITEKGKKYLISGHTVEVFTANNNESFPEVVTSTIEACFKNPLDGKIYSVKPSNIAYRPYRATKSIMEAAASSEAITAGSWVYKVAGIFLMIDSIKNMFSVELSVDQSCALLTLWRQKNCIDGIPVDDGYIQLNQYKKDIGETEVTIRKYMMILNELEEIKCLHSLDGKIYLDEKIIDINL